MFTVLGASGFIGSHLASYLRTQHENVNALSRHERVQLNKLGHVICCVGLTADFRTRPIETMDAHVNYLLPILQSYDFESFTYLSSTRVYGSADGYLFGKASEDNPILSQPQDPDQLYNISKLAGESVCLSSGRKNVRVVRLSNVYGYDPSSENFVFALIRSAVRAKSIILRTARNSSKDYVSVFDVVKLLPRIAEKGQQRVYNVASGHNIRAGWIVDKVQDITDCGVVIDKEAPMVSFPTIDTERVTNEFGFRATDLLDELEPLVREFELKEATAK